MLAHFAAAVERHGQDRGLQSIRRDIAQDPIMEAAYRHGLPHWIRAVGPDAVEHDGAVRPLVHPDPRWGRTDCRIVGETPKSLQDMGYTRMTLVLREARQRGDRTAQGAQDPERRGGAAGGVSPLGLRPVRRRSAVRHVRHHQHERNPVARNQPHPFEALGPRPRQHGPEVRPLGE